MRIGKIKIDTTKYYLIDEMITIWRDMNPGVEPYIIMSPQTCVFLWEKNVKLLGEAHQYEGAFDVDENKMIMSFHGCAVAVSQKMEYLELEIR